jgi:hypothetical protein
LKASEAARIFNLRGHCCAATAARPLLRGHVTLEVEELCNFVDDDPAERTVRPVAKGAGMADEAAGEFAAVLHAQISGVRGELEQARESRDIEGITALGLRLRYLLEVAADSGIDPDDAQDTGRRDRVVGDAEG